MTLALLVSFGTLVFYLLILFVRWCRVRPSSEGASRHAWIAAAGMSGAGVGAGYPILWAMFRNLGGWFEHGSTTFTFVGNLPPGVDEDDLLPILVIGTGYLIGQAVAEVWRACR
jgi:hypothetical protein